MRKEVIKEKKFNNRLLYTFILLGIIFALSFGVNAFGTSSPSTFGHSVGELDFTGGFNVPNGIIEISGANDNPLILKSTDNNWLYLEWKNSSGVRKAWTGLGNDLNSFSISLENGANKIILNNANVGIGTQTPSEKLDVSGNVKVSGDVTANAFLYSSDIQLKENIKPLTNPLDKINQLQGVSFNWKDTGRQDIGLIAQDVEKVIPEIVDTNSEGLKSVEYGNLVALLIEAVKEQQKEIESLKKQINRG